MYERESTMKKAMLLAEWVSYKHYLMDVYAMLAKYDI